LKQLSTYALCTLLLLGTPAIAQDEEKGGLEGLLERSLSSETFQVTVDGLSGALSSTASIEKLTFSDATGPWMEIENAALNWTRSALLRGRVQVAELAAERIRVLRLPEGGAEEPELPSAAAEPFSFSLPELPVAVAVDRISAGEIVLDEPVLGEEVRATLEGGLRLADGEGSVALELVRTDVTGTALDLDASFENESQEIVVAFDARAREGGLLARKTGIPNAPGLQLTVAGQGVLSDFSADIDFATDDSTRLGGIVRLLAETPEATTEPNAAVDRRIVASLSGDIRPLVTADLQSFFGEETGLDVETVLAATGAIDLPRIQLRTNQLDLTGSVALNEEKWPEQVALFARLHGVDGAPVAIPVPGTPTSLSRAFVSFTYDAEAASVWSAVISASDLSQGEIAVESIDLRGAGALTLPDPAATDPTGAVSGQISGGIDGLELGDPALQGTVRNELALSSAFSWEQGGALEISGAEIEAGDLELTLEGLLENLAEGIDFTGAVSVNAPDLGRFAALTGQALDGSITLEAEGSATLLSGMFDLDVTGSAENLVTGIAQADALMGGTVDLQFDGSRDQNGIALRTALLQTGALDVKAGGNIGGGSGNISLEAELDNLARLVPDLPGPARLEGSARQSGDRLLIDAAATGPGGLGLSLDGNMSSDFSNAEEIDFDGALSVNAPDLGRFASLTGQDLNGSVALDAEGSMTLLSGLFDLDITATARNFATGIAQADALLGGAVDLQFDGSRDESGIALRTANLQTGALDVQASGNLGGGRGEIALIAELDNLARLVPDLPGRTRLEGTVQQSGDRLVVDADGTGPGGLNLSLDGDLASDFSSADLQIDGGSSLVIVSPFLEPRTASGQLTFDLALNGAPGLDALAGTVAIADSRISDPTIGFALERFGGQAQLRSGAVNLDFAGNGNRGGRVTIGGNLGLTGSQTADLTVVLANLRLAVQGFLQAQVDGEINFAGPLAGGAQLTGGIDIDEAEIRVPDGAGASSDIEGLRHVGASPTVRTTLARAGMLATPEPTTPQGGAGGPVIGLDVTVDAPTKIFVRGFGLDAELGGDVRVTGTSAAPRPVGEFELIRGRLSFLGRRLDLTEGVIRLSADLIPDIRFVATTRTNDGDVSVVIEGPADDPEVSFESSPPLPEDEVLARLLFGTEISELSGIQALRLANALLAVRNGTGLGLFNSLREEAGLDDLDLVTDEDGQTSLRLGKYISEDVYTNVDVNPDGETELILNIDLTDDLTARGIAGTDNSAIGLFFQRDY